MTKWTKKRDRPIRFRAGVSLKTSSILRCLGIPVEARGSYLDNVGKDTPFLLDKIFSLRDIGNQLLKVQGIYCILTHCQWLQYMNGLNPLDHGVNSNDKAYDQVMPALLTLGKTFDQGKKAFPAEDVLSQWIWEGIGNAALMEAQQWFSSCLVKKLNISQQLINQWAPGDGSYSLEIQKVIFDILRPASMGIILNEHYNIVPAKTLTQVFLFSKQGDYYNNKEAISLGHDCQRCSQNNCLFRIF